MNNDTTATATTLPIQQLARYLAGDGADYEALRLVWPDLPTDRRAALLWVQGRPDLASAIFQADLAASNGDGRKTLWTANELLTVTLPEPRWAVPDLIPEGLVSLAGRPKLGKSWLALQLACAVGTGGKALGRNIQAGRVLYLALEDSARRLQKRMQAQHWPAGANVTFALEWPDLTGAGLEALRSSVAESGYSLVVIDTLSRAAAFDQMDPTASTRVMAGLQRIAIECSATLLLVDHHRKRNGFDSDVIDDVLGATAKTAVLDAALGLYRERGKREATLAVTGRDLEDTKLSLEWDPTTCTWQCLGDAGTVITKTRQSTILAALYRVHPDTLSGNELSEITGFDRGDVSRLLADLENAGLVRRCQREGKTIPYALTQSGIDKSQMYQTYQTYQT